LRKGAGVDSVRRPLRGVEIKDDTHAVIRVIGADGKEIPLISSGYPGGMGTDYTNFILQSVREAREEKTNILETFGDDYIFFFGEKPRFLNVAAVLLNSFDFNWEAEFWANYESKLRGTKCAESGAKVYLFYDDNIVEGYMMNASAQKGADIPMQVMLSFVLFVTSIKNVSFVKSDDYPRRPSSFTGEEPFVQVAGLSQERLNPTDVPAWLARAEAIANDSETSEQNRIGRTLPIRSKIVDNVDEWTGDYSHYNLDWARVQKALNEEAKRVQDEFVKKSCQFGVFGNNPGALSGFGLIGPGDSMSFGNLKDAWSAAKRGDMEGVVSNLVTSNVTASFNTPWGTGVATAGTNPEDGAYSDAAWLSKSDLDKSHAGAGAGYYSGGGVGYNPFTGQLPGPAGKPGYYAGAGYFGPNQRGVPGHGSGGAPAGTARQYSAGAWAGWSPGEGGSAGTWSQGTGNPPPGARGNSMFSAGAQASAGVGAYAGAGASINAGARITGGAFIGASGAGGYASGYRPGARSGRPMTASNMYYAAAGASWDPDNGFQWGASKDPTQPVPGQPGGGLFTTQALGGSLDQNKWTPAYEQTGIFQGASTTPYGRVNPKKCSDLRGKEGNV
jgi:hypothetical protein